MACCILGALILGNLIMLWRKLAGRILRGSGSAGAAPPVAAASWRPGTIVVDGSAAAALVPRDASVGRRGRALTAVPLLVIVLMGVGAGYSIESYTNLGRTLTSIRDAASVSALAVMSWCRGGQWRR